MNAIRWTLFTALVISAFVSSRAQAGEYDLRPFALLSTRAYINQMDSNTQTYYSDPYAASGYFGPAALTRTRRPSAVTWYSVHKGYTSGLQTGLPWTEETRRGTRQRFDRTQTINRDLVRNSRLAPRDYYVRTDRRQPAKSIKLDPLNEESVALPASSKTTTPTPTPESKDKE